MLLAHDEIQELLRTGVVENANPVLVNGTSLDITLGPTLLTELSHFGDNPVIDFRQREPLPQREVKMDPEQGYLLAPGEFVLGGSAQVFNLPLTLSADYKLKSSMARVGLQHLNAGWCDPGWNGSVLTMELVNVCRYHSIRIRPGDRIGQMVFFRHWPVPVDRSYATVGRYNGDRRVEGIKL